MIKVLTNGERESEPHQCDQQWSQLKINNPLATKENIAMEDDETDLSDQDDMNTDSNLFSCPEDGCIKSYQKHTSLLNHLSIGKHVLRPERITLRDAAINSYASHLETIRPTPRLIDIQDALQNFYDVADSRITEQTEGWALKSERICGIFRKTKMVFIGQIQ